MSWADIINDDSLTFNLADVSMEDIDSIVEKMSANDTVIAAAVLGLGDVVEEAERKKRIIAALKGGMRLLKGFIA